MRAVVTVTGKDKKGIIAKVSGFLAETLSTKTVSHTMPRYNSQGQELEYRWVETGVYQGEDITEDNIDSQENLLTDGGFTLSQAGRSYGYYAEASDPEKDGSTWKTELENG